MQFEYKKEKVKNPENLLKRKERKKKNPTPIPIECLPIYTVNTKITTDENKTSTPSIFGYNTVTFFCSVSFFFLLKSEEFVVKCRVEREKIRKKEKNIRD